MIKVISIPFNVVVAGFDDSEIREFTKDKQIENICHHFFIRDGVPYLTFVVKYKGLCPPPPPALDTSKNKESTKNSEAWRKILTESDVGLFNLFREWRAKRSRKEGVPPYVLFNNNQLAQIVIKRPQSLAELSKIEGIGKAKLEKYGKEILEISKIEASDGGDKK